MIHEKASGRLFVLEKVYEWLLAKVGNDGGDYLEGKTLDDMSLIDFAQIVAKHDYDIDQINLDVDEEAADDFWMGAYSEWTEFKNAVKSYRK